MHEKQRVKLDSTESTISLGKSKRLMAMRKSVELSQDKGILHNKSLSSSNKKESEVQQAREAIRQKFSGIKSTYPQGMQNKLFAIRYGSDEEIKQMTLAKLFNILNIKQRLTEDFSELKYGGG